MYGIQICYEIARRRFGVRSRLQRSIGWLLCLAWTACTIGAPTLAAPADADAAIRRAQSTLGGANVKTIIFCRGRLRRPVRASLRAKSGVAKANDSPDDGTEQLVGIISAPVYSRTVSLPD
jgi:hypothetical protein